MNPCIREGTPSLAEGHTDYSPPMDTTSLPSATVVTAPVPFPSAASLAPDAAEFVSVTPEPTAESVHSNIAVGSTLPFATADNAEATAKLLAS